LVNIFLLLNVDWIKREEAKDRSAFLSFAKFYVKS